jgi:hypothetical protein
LEKQARLLFTFVATCSVVTLIYLLAWSATLQGFQYTMAASPWPPLSWLDWRLKRSYSGGLCLDSLLLHITLFDGLRSIAMFGCFLSPGSTQRNHLVPLPEREREREKGDLPRNETAEVNV